MYVLYTAVLPSSGTEVRAVPLCTHEKITVFRGAHKLHLLSFQKVDAYKVQ
jgi:hypothetical protein